MAAAADLVEGHEGRIDRLDPAPRGFKDLAPERREGDRNQDRGRSLAGRKGCWPGRVLIPRYNRADEAPLALQPGQRDVVDDVFLGQIAHGLAVDESAGDLVVAVRVVVEHPGCEPEGCIQQGSSRSSAGGWIAPGSSRSHPS